MNYEHLALTTSDGVAHIQLQRLSMHLPFMKELLSAVRQCDSDSSVRAVLFSSNQKLFNAGGDLAYFANSGDDIGAAIKELTIYLHAAISLLHRMDKPTVIAVNGAAAGAGMSFAVQGDFVIAADTASFMGAYTAAGLSPDGSATYFLPRLIGERRTKELLITNRKLSAQEALTWGLVNQVVAAGTELATAQALAQQLASGPTRAFGSVKRLVMASSGNTLEGQMALESEHIARNADGVDGKEGVQAFMNKRPAQFTGE